MKTCTPSRMIIGIAWRILLSYSEFPYFKQITRSSLSKIYCLLLLLLLLLPFHTFAQTPVNCATGRVLFKEDFGHIPPNVSTTPLPAGITTYPFSPFNGNIPDGQYSIARVPTGYAAFWYYPCYDHTDPRTGYQMIINGAYDPGQFYTVTIHDLCPNTQLYFSACVQNLMMKTVAGIDPDLRFELRDGVTNAFLFEHTTGPIPKAESAAWTDMWKQYGFPFTTGTTASIKLTIYNNASGSGTGNDFALDDIEIGLCTGPISVIPTRTSICEVGTLRGTYDDLDGSFIDGSGNVGYAWQYSATGSGLDWATVATGVTPNPVQNEHVPAQTGYYRFIVSAPGNQERDNCRAISEPLHFIIYPVPTIANITSTVGARICAGGTATISATTDLASVEWYSDAALTTKVSTDLSYTTPVLNTNAIYYVVAKNAEGCIALPDNAAEVNVIVNSRPPTPTIDGDASVCENTEETYSTDPGMLNYQWQIADGTIISGGGIADNTVTVRWGIAGNGSVKLNYENVGQCEAITPANLQITIHPNPADSDITGNASVCLGSTETYTTAAGMSSYVWVVNGGVILSGGGLNDNTVTIEWPPTNGNHTVSVLYLNTSGCSSTKKTLNVKVDNVLTPSIEGNLEVCEKSTMTYTTESGKSNYDWSVTGGVVNSGGTATDNTINITWGARGTGRISVNYKGVAGCTPLSPTSKDIFINALPTKSNITKTVGAAICSGETATISATTDLARVEWYSDAGLTNKIGVDSSYTTPPLTTNTTYYVVAKSAQGCITPPSGAVPVIVTVNPRPTAANITGTTPATICMGMEATISATTDMANVYWYSDAALTILVGTGSTFTTPILNATTVYYAVAVTTNGCIAAAGQVVSVTVLSIPVPVPVITGPTELCGNSSATYITDSGMNDYVWETNGGDIISGNGTNSINVMWHNDSSGIVSTNYLQACRSKTTMLPVGLTSVTVITSQPQSTSACRMSTIQLSVAAEGVDLTYQWFHEGTDIIGATSATYELANVEEADSGHYTVQVTGDCGVVTSQPVTVTIIKSEIVQKWDDVILIDNSCFCLAAYQWYRDGVFLNGETKQFFEEKGGLNGTYVAEVTRLDGTKYFTCPLTVFKPTSIMVRVYPNPVGRDNELRVEVDAAEIIDNMMLELYTADGRLLHRRTVESHEVTLPAIKQVGFYILRIVTPEKSFVRRVIVE